MIASTPYRRGKALLAAVFAATLVAGFLALGTWQLQRLQWKLDLIERTQQRVHAAVVAAPSRADWATISSTTHEYLHVFAEGVWLDARSSWVQASTELGAGFWLLTPLQQPSGDLVMVNRGFVPTELRADVEHQLRADRPSTLPVTIVGLLRLTEPRGGFLRHNDPSAQRWYSRDIEALAASQQLRDVAPYFIDADAASPSLVSRAGQAFPVGGLTVVTFHNSHLVYALTWYSLALMLAGACWWIRRDARRRRT